VGRLETAGWIDVAGKLHSNNNKYSRVGHMTELENGQLDKAISSLKVIKVFIS
jgi:hypothetical protein